MRRFALVVIVEADSEGEAMNIANDFIGLHERVVYLGDPCPVGPADEYETEAIHLTADGELAVAAPLPVQQ